MNLTEEYILIGKVAKAKGLKGHFFVQLYNENSDLFSFAQSLWIKNKQDEISPYSILSSKLESGRWLVSLEGIDDRSAAQELVNLQIMYPRSLFPETQDNEIYVYDLVGLDVIDENKRLIGQVIDVIDSKAHEILNIQDCETNKQWLCPFHQEYVKDVNLESKQICLKNWEQLREI